MLFHKYTECKGPFCYAANTSSIIGIWILMLPEDRIWLCSLPIMQFLKHMCTCICILVHTCV